MLSEEENLTYGELGKRVHSVSECLKSFGVEAEVPVALFFNRSPNQIIAIYAVLEAGGFYLPLDPSWPECKKSGYTRRFQCLLYFNCYCLAGHCSKNIQRSRVLP